MYKITIKNIKISPYGLAFPQVDSSLTHPVILLADINNFDFDNNKMFNRLNEDEKTRANKFKHEKSKKTFILAHFLNQYFLRKYHLTSNETINYNIGKFGKPYLQNKPSVFFNISHSEDMVAIAYFNNETGVDIEFIKDDKKQIDLIRHYYFSPSENNLIDIDKKRFYEFWTKKESILKAVACGITDEIKKIETAGPSQEIFLEEESFKNFNKKELFTWSWKIHDYFVSLSSDTLFKKINLIEVLEKDIEECN